MIQRPPISTPLYSSAASDVYKRQVELFKRYKIMEKKLFKKKTALIMKMTFLFILFGFLQVTAKVHPGTNGSPELLMANAGIKVTGKVTSKSDGQAIPGVNVVLKGTTDGVITNIDGAFT